MRVTFNSQYNSSQASIDAAIARLTDLQRQVASGKRVQKPSDDPGSAAAAVVEHGEVSNVERYERAADSVSSRLTILDTALSDVVDQVTNAQVAATSARGSAKTPQERELAAKQIEGIRTALLEDFNTSFHGNYVFAGAASTTKPYVVDAAGVVAPYAGSVTEVASDVGPQRAVTVGVNGDAITKGSDPTDVFGVLNNLIAAARAGDDVALGAGITALNNVFERVTAAQGAVGVNMNAVESEKARLEDTRLAGNARLTQLEDANLAEVIPAMTQADTAYRAALGAIGSASRVSLMDYLK